ncbi:MAG: two-component sensor histidine kinase, partial [Cytophagaceae bacterium]|nr:two-component sensor histidine kinase [Cytophagaceae bacterium]
WIGLTLNNMTSPYIGLNLLDSARIVNQQAYKLIRQHPQRESILEASIIRNTGRLHELAGDYPEALAYYRKALQLTYRDNNLRSRAQIQYFIANLFKQLHKPDSSLHYAKLALQNSRYVYKTNILRTVQLVTQIYTEQHQLDSAFHYQQLAISANDSMYGAKNFQNLQRLVLNEQQRQQALQEEQKENQNRVRFYMLLAGLGVVLLIAFFLYRNNRQKHKVNTLLNEQKAKVEQALETLKTTQTQLIQREKMASLGELTAGIAHEIQNPLNFVNNFSEVSTELVGELREEEAKADKDPELIGELLDDLTQNLEKITHHGQRASSIVKGMLEHSRTSSGEKQPTDLNALADEYLRLAYHGLRAKDKSFNTTLQTDFDPNLPKVQIVSQDISRVLLNLFNNAFYAVQEKQKQKQQPIGYQPTVSVSTKQENGHVEIRVRDNGTGMPPEVVNKVFQPFYTTKPAGQGTGLGLSLSYDIMTKGHGGEIRVESVEGAYTEFIVRLPE